MATAISLTGLGSRGVDSIDPRAFVPVLPPPTGTGRGAWLARSPAAQTVERKAALAPAGGLYTRTWQSDCPAALTANRRGEEEEAGGAGGAGWPGRTSPRSPALGRSVQLTIRRCLRFACLPPSQAVAEDWALVCRLRHHRLDAGFFSMVDRAACGGRVARTLHLTRRRIDVGHLAAAQTLSKCAKLVCACRCLDFLTSVAREAARADEDRPSLPHPKAIVR